MCFLQQPHRILDGLSTFAMPLGFWMGGGRVSSVLFLSYLLHSLASLAFHLVPSEPLYAASLFFLHLMTMERLFQWTHNMGVYLFYLASMVPESLVFQSHWGVAARAMVAVVLLTPSLGVLFLWAVCFMAFLQNMSYLQKGDPFYTTLTGCFFHLYLGALSLWEAHHAPHYNPPSLLDEFFRYVFYLVLLSHSLLLWTHNPKRLRSVLSLVAAVVLTPLSFYQLWQQCRLWPDRVVYRDGAQPHILLFYIAYCVVDMMFGYVCYPQYFTMLDGWAHHIGTAGFALAFLWKEKEVVFCIGLVVESSSIVLCLSRVLYDVKWVRVLRDRCFGTLFLVSRIVLPTLGMVYFYPQSMDPVCATMHMLGTTLHCHWFCHFQQKKKLKP